MKKSVIIGIVLVSVLLAMPLAFAGGMTTEITGECTFYDRGIEYERCCPMGAKINCVSCRDTDGGRDYYVKGETMEKHWNRFEGGVALGSGTMPLIDRCVVKNVRTPGGGCEGTVTEVELNGTLYRVCNVDGKTISISHISGNVIQEDEENVLREGYCEMVGEYSKYKYEEYECPNGCVNGACVREDECPDVIGWRIEGIKCFVDSGCNYDSSKDYYDSAEECIKGLGKVEYPVLEPLPVPDICSDLLIEEDIEGYNYRETKYSRMGPDVYSEDGKQIGTTKCCIAYYKKNIIDIMGSVAYVCSYDSRKDTENSIKWIANDDEYELGEYMSQEVYWMRKNVNVEINLEAILWTNNNNILVVGKEGGGAIPEDIAEAYLGKHNSDLGDVDVEIVEVTPELTTEPETIGEPIDIPEEKMFYSCTGCELEGKCYPIGYRKGGQYCGINNEFVSQISEGGCDNNFECESNVCVSGECVEEGLMRRIIKWFRRLFG